MKIFIKYFFLVTILLPATVKSQIIKTRIYKKGDSFRYQLTTETFNNNQPQGKTVAISLHTIVADDSSLAEEVHWVSKSIYTKKDSLIIDSIARKVAPYRISLTPMGTLRIPPLIVPEMTGEITDLNTFYVAVSPNLHVQQLSKRHSSFKDSVLHGHFADSIQILYGEDVIEVTQKLLKQNWKISVIETSFKPPLVSGLNPLCDTIGKQTFLVPNNFQMIRKGQGDKVNLLWGVEEFIITSTIDNRTGQILQADMINQLNLRMRYNSTADLKAYDAEIPLAIKRVLHLSLMK